jgi:hypothetical protein
MQILERRLEESTKVQATLAAQLSVVHEALVQQMKHVRFCHIFFVIETDRDTGRRTITTAQTGAFRGSR